MRGPIADAGEACLLSSQRLAVLFLQRQSAILTVNLKRRQRSRLECQKRSVCLLCEIPWFAIPSFGPCTQSPRPRTSTLQASNLLGLNFCSKDNQKLTG